MFSHSSEDITTHLLPDILAPNLDVIFVGAAPSHWSAREGHYYAGPTNKFWLLLYQSGFTPRQLLPEEDVQVLKYGIGLTGIYKNISSSANHLLPVPTPELRLQLQEKLLGLNPRILCFNGKDVYHLCIGRICMDWGLQEESPGKPKIFVLHSSSARADGWGNERLALYHELRHLLEQEKQAIPVDLNPSFGVNYS